jgi:hypothetical protein
VTIGYDLAAEDGWIPWTGGECPVLDGTLVDVRYRDGQVEQRLRANENINGYVRDAGLSFWLNDSQSNDIIAYRLSDECILPAPTRPAPPMPDVKPTKVEQKDTNPKDSIGIRKAPLSVLPMSVVAEVGTAMLEGACKYGRHNWRAMGVRDSVYFDATMRHLIDYWEGVDIDTDSGMHHLTKAMSSLMVWRDAQLQGMCTDDRPPRSESFYVELNKKAGEIIDKHADKSPKHWTIADNVKDIK